MKNSRSIKIKALALSAVFSLNTVLGFACSIGMDLGYNSSHHQEAVAEPAVHNHEHGGHHQHDHEEANKAVHKHDDGKQHDHHDQLQKDDSDSKKLPTDDDCCNNGVYKFNNLDKNLTQQKTGIEFQSLSIVLHSLFSVAELNINDIPLLHTSRYMFPPPPDILVSIQKFQI